MGVCDVEMKWACCVEDDLDAWGLDNLIEGVRLRDVRHNGRLQAVLAQAGMGGVDLGGLVVGTDSGHDIVATRQELLEDVGRDEARATCAGLLARLINQLEAAGKVSRAHR